MIMHTGGLVTSPTFFLTEGEPIIPRRTFKGSDKILIITGAEILESRKLVDAIYKEVILRKGRDEGSDVR